MSAEGSSQPKGDRTRSRPNLREIQRKSAIGASFPFPLAPVEVGSLNGHRPFSLGGGNGSKCPTAAIWRSIVKRLSYASL
jgi:hypothetical protein